MLSCVRKGTSSPFHTPAGTYGRYRDSRNKSNILTHKIMRSGLLKTNCQGVHFKKGDLKVKQWSGMVNAQPQPIPSFLDWDMYCGPAALRPYHKHRGGAGDGWRPPAGRSRRWRSVR